MIEEQKKSTLTIEAVLVCEIAIAYAYMPETIEVLSEGKPEIIALHRVIKNDFETTKFLIEHHGVKEFASRKAISGFDFCQKLWNMVDDRIAKDNSDKSRSFDDLSGDCFFINLTEGWTDFELKTVRELLSVSMKCYQRIGEMK